MCIRDRTKIENLTTTFSAKLDTALASLANIDIDLDSVKETLGRIKDTTTSIHTNTSNIDANLIQTNTKLDTIVTNTTPETPPAGE